VLDGFITVWIRQFMVRALIIIHAVKSVSVSFLGPYGWVAFPVLDLFFANLTVGANGSGAMITKANQVSNPHLILIILT
jgi:hypothetical protein